MGYEEAAADHRRVKGSKRHSKLTLVAEIGQNLMDALISGKINTSWYHRDSSSSCGSQQSKGIPNPANLELEAIHKYYEEQSVVYERELCDWQRVLDAQNDCLQHIKFDQKYLKEKDAKFLKEMESEASLRSETFHSILVWLDSLDIQVQITLFKD
jgi:hypothetical protein